MAHQSLAELAQQENREHQKHDVAGGDGNKTGRRQADTGHHRKDAQIDPVDDPTRPRQHQSAGQGADHIDQAPVAVAEAELGTQVRPEHANEERLAKAR